jgi:hypothetical protein
MRRNLNELTQRAPDAVEGYRTKISKVALSSASAAAFVQVAANCFRAGLEGKGLELLFLALCIFKPDAGNQDLGSITSIDVFDRHQRAA